MGGEGEKERETEVRISFKSVYFIQHVCYKCVLWSTLTASMLIVCIFTQQDLHKESGFS